MWDSLDPRLTSRLSSLIREICQYEVETMRYNDTDNRYLPALELIPAIIGVDQAIVLGIYDLADRAAETVLLRYSDVEDFHGGDHN